MLVLLEKSLFLQTEKSFLINPNIKINLLKMKSFPRFASLLPWIVIEMFLRGRRLTDISIVHQILYEDNWTGWMSPLFWFNVLKNTFSAGISVWRLQIELWGVGSRGKRPGTGTVLLHKKGHDQTLRGTAGAKDPQTFTYLDCEDIKAQGFLCLSSLLRDTQFELLSCYLTIAPR